MTAAAADLATIGGTLDEAAAYASAEDANESILNS
jgi:hypothetical protein